MAAGFRDLLAMLFGWHSSPEAVVLTVSQRYPLIGADDQRFGLIGANDAYLPLIGADDSNLDLEGA